MVSIWNLWLSLRNIGQQAWLFVLHVGKWGLYGLYCDPDSKVYGANMGPIWGRQDPGGAHVGPMNFDIWEYI